ncbi:MAG: nucleotidyltransferase domain-containing protein [Phycisphaerae bacterium]|nr:nucleotidyltransferase domain-containing protein [Phycisphaerae bacterium]
MRLCRSIIDKHPYPLLFATVSGAHLYGFASEDSDYDLRGAHILPACEVLSLHEPKDTVQSEGIVEGVEIDLVTHDLEKFLRLMLKKNGYVLEQLLSPLVVRTSPEHAELIELAPRCITKHHAFHYLGFAETQWNLFRKEDSPRVKPLLYVYRVLLTGIHLMRTGTVDANLPNLNREYRLPYIEEMILQKISGAEKEKLVGADLQFHEREYFRLRTRLEEEHARSSLPEANSALDPLSDLLVRVRSKTPWLPR